MIDSLLLNHCTATASLILTPLIPHVDDYRLVIDVHEDFDGPPLAVVQIDDAMPCMKTLG